MTTRADPGGGPPKNTYGLPAGVKLAASLKKWFIKQKKAVLAAIPDAGPFPDHFPDLTAAEWVDPMASAMTPILAGYWSKHGKEVTERLGLDPDHWEVTNPHLKAQIEKQSFSFCSSTNGTTSKSLAVALAQLREAFVAGQVAEGENLAELRKRVQGVFEGMSRWKADQIAATEASRAVHAAQETAAAESGVVVGLELLLSADACPLCRKVATECKRVRLGQSFAVIGSHPEYSKIRFPPIHPHCQCTAIEILSPEYGGPTQVEWGHTLFQPQKGLKDGYEPPHGVPEAVPEPHKVPPRVQHPHIPDRLHGLKPPDEDTSGDKPTFMPPDLDLDDLKSIDLHKAEPTWSGANQWAKKSYGGVVFDDQGRILLREPSNHFDGYVWTFPKGGMEHGSNPVDTGRKEVLEETGHHTAIMGLVPGKFQSGSSTENYYFIMRSTGHDPAQMDGETQATKWVTPEEAKKLIALSTNAKGKQRDLEILEAASQQWAKMHATGTVNDHLKAAIAAAKVPPPPPPPLVVVPPPAPVAKPKKPRKPKATPAAAPAPTLFPTPAAPPAKAGPSGPHPDAAKFPDDPDRLTFVKKLGGSTGAELVKDADGKLYVRKRGANPGHLREEVLADDAYRALGARVPVCRLYETAAGPVKLAEHVEGRTLAEVLKADPALAKKAIADLSRHFAADALMGNWDVVGMSKDNVLVDKAGNAYRIDNGGSLRYRAQGAKKAAAEWNAYPTEVWTLRDKAKNAQTASAFGHLTIGEIAGQVEAMRAQAGQLGLPPEVQKMIDARMEQLNHVAATARIYLGDKYTDSHADQVAKHTIGVRAAGIVDAMPASMKGKTPTDVTMVDENGKAFDHLRGRDSLVTKLDAYIKANGGDYSIVSTWMSAQGGSSWSSDSQALKYHLVQARGGDPAEYFWRDGVDVAKKKYESRVANYGREKYEASFAAYQAFTRELLLKTDYQGKNADGTVTVKRTEPAVAMGNAKPGDKGLTIKRGAAESTSQVKWFSLYGSEKTEQKVPFHRVLGVYWAERTPGGGTCGFLGDNENEFVCLLEGLKVDYLKR